jgi:RNA polymerase-binding protein DksA
MEPFSEIKKQLLALREDYTRRIEAIKVDTHHQNEPVEKDFAEQATQSENDDVLASLNHEAEQMVIQINAALARIEEGQYGICAECNSPIPEERLKVAPFADLCISCAEKTSP